MTDHAKEMAEKQRFGFGENWTRFLTQLNDERIEKAEDSLKDMLGVQTLQGKSFLDIGSGSGLFSLAARRLGARVRSFDYDPKSVACTAELKRRYFPDDKDWTVEEGSALDATYVQSLGLFDVVYSWGVLHHTGAMALALDHASLAVKPGGALFIALYNDQGWVSGYWSWVKRIYLSGLLGRWAMIAMHFPYLIGARVLYRLLTGRFRLDRGMSYWYDMKDWLGGWPFEVSSTDEIESLFRDKGYTSVRTVSCGGAHGCNEYVFRKGD